MIKRYSEQEIQFIKDNYQTKGNKTISMNLQVTIPENWQKLSFEEWIDSINNKLKKIRL